MQNEDYQNEQPDAPSATSNPQPDAPSPATDQADLADEIFKNSGKIQSLALVAGSDDFNEWSPEVRSNFMWALSDLATQQRKDIDDYLTRT